MMASRGMGNMAPSKMPKGRTVQRKDGCSCEVYAKGGPVWETPNPAKKSKPLSPAKKASAKQMAKAAGRPYPNLVDNMRAARKK